MTPRRAGLRPDLGAPSCRGVRPHQGAAVQSFPEFYACFF
ncbi:Uncharacterised protein [Bordetella pertussis]|nr:Uncharacterised protein [Bordetella pertussis]CFW31675.1 Uncharacterised protein [Bordetella pertussis]